MVYKKKLSLAIVTESGKLNQILLHLLFAKTGFHWTQGDEEVGRITGKEMR